MIIEINSPILKVSHEAATAMERKVMRLARSGEKISRAEIFLTEENSTVKENKNCKIRLDIFGDTLFAHKTAETFERAAESGIKILKKMLKGNSGQRNVLPDEIITTVNI